MKSLRLPVDLDSRHEGVSGVRPRIHVLIVEDDVVDRMACRRALKYEAACEFVLSEAETGREGLELAKSIQPDCILLDYSLPDLNGLEFLKALAGESGEVGIPVMLLTGADSTKLAVEAMKSGASDYLGKDVDRQYLDLLPTAIQRMLRERRLAKEKRQAEAKFRTLVEQIQAITYMVGPEQSARLIYISPQIRILGYSPDEWLNDPELPWRSMHPDDRSAATQAIRENRGMGLRHEYRLISRDGNALWFRDESQTVTDESGRKLFVQGILVDITQSKHIEEELRQSKNELRQLAAHQERLKEEERKRIAQEVHDELGGLLASIKAHVSVSNDRLVRAGAAPDQLLIDAAALAEAGLKAVRKVITDLRPSVLDQLGIWAALEWYTGQIEERSGIMCEWLVDEPTSNVSLDQERSTMLFRVVQESLTNAVRHAEASHIAVSASCEDGVIAVTVQDNGKGIDTDRLLNRESWGILGMYERSRHFGGELRITGTPGGGGTLVVLRLPGIDQHGKSTN